MQYTSRVPVNVLTDENPGNLASGRRVSIISYEVYDSIGPHNGRRSVLPAS
jgi:hypothetical protein